MSEWLRPHWRRLMRAIHWYRSKLPMHMLDDLEAIAGRDDAKEFLQSYVEFHRALERHYSTGEPLDLSGKHKDPPK